MLSPFVDGFVVGHGWVYHASGIGGLSRRLLSRADDGRERLPAVRSKSKTNRQLPGYFSIFRVFLLEMGMTVARVCGKTREIYHQNRF